MRDMALPHLTSVTAWRPVQGSTTCSLEPGQHLFPMLLSSRMFGLPFPRVSSPSPCGRLCLVCVACI